MAVGRYWIKRQWRLRFFTFGRARSFDSGSARRRDKTHAPLAFAQDDGVFNGGVPLLEQGGFGACDPFRFGRARSFDSGSARRRDKTHAPLAFAQDDGEQTFLRRSPLRRLIILLQRR